jgi:hypothetical protein
MSEHNDKYIYEYPKEFITVLKKCLPSLEHSPVTSFGIRDAQHIGYTVGKDEMVSTFNMYEFIFRLNNIMVEKNITFSLVYPYKDAREMILTTHYFRKTETKEIKKIKSSKRKQSLRIQDVIDTLIKMYLLESKREEKSL